MASVACDPAALGRDVAIFAEHGYELTAIRAFDLFPMTHNVECAAPVWVVCGLSRMHAQRGVRRVRTTTKDGV